METLAEGGPSGPSPIARLASPPLHAHKGICLHICVSGEKKLGKKYGIVVRKTCVCVSFCSHACSS